MGGSKRGESGAITPRNKYTCSAARHHPHPRLDNSKKRGARFGVGWGSLLPADLAAEALRAQAPNGGLGLRFGLGWPLHPDRNLAGLVGGAPGAVASLLIVPGVGRASVMMTNRLVPAAIEQANARLLLPDTED